MKGQKNSNRRSNYFQQNVQKFGENFISRKNPAELELDAIRIFRDIARGNIDVQKDGPYFLDTQFLESCLTAANLKLNLHTTNYNGVLMLVNNNLGSSMTMSILEYNKRCMEAYTIIYNHLMNIKATKDINYLTTMVGNLRNYRNNI